MPGEQLENIIAMLRSAASEPGATEMTIDQWREAYAGLAALSSARGGVPVTPVDAGGVDAEWIGANADGPVVVYVHGGGYCIGSLETHRPMLTHLADAIGGRVLSVDYRLAPEHPHPAALDDALSAYRFVLDAGVLARRIVIAGDSAGGGLALAILFAIRDMGLPRPAAGVCLSPWADLTQSGETMRSKADEDPMVRGADLDRWADCYRGDLLATTAAISPLFGEYRDLPPLHIEVGTAEVLLDDARRVHVAAQEAGVDVTLHEGPGLIHVWHFFAGAVPEADEGIARVGKFVRDRAG